jgi:transposase
MSVDTIRTSRPAPTADPAARALGEPTAGIDWASDEHAVAVVNADGVQHLRATVAHTKSGLNQLVRILARAGVREVGIERGDGPVVDALLAAGFVVFVIAPNQVRNLRRRYGAAGNKDDHFDAYVLADTVRTDRHRLSPLVPDGPATVALRMSVRARQDLVAARVSMANQLRAHLTAALPGAIKLFRDIDSAITLAFLTRFPTQAKVDWLSPTRLQAWLRTQRYPNPRRAEVLHAHLVDAARGTTGPQAEVGAQVTAAYVAVLRTLQAQIAALEDDIEDQLAAHPDAPIFTSLPKAGTVRAARLLAEIGDCRSRFPTAQALISLAGAAPSTRQSGKVTVIGFRWAVDKQLRGAVMDFAGDSHHANAWAADRYWKARDRGKDHSHATRILARAWLLVIWRCWQDHQPYDPTQHRAYQALQTVPA